jgi:nucleoid DNA-binding protein
MIIPYIKKYILENRHVKIYRLGTFELQYREAEVHPILKEFTPPGQYLSFTFDETEEGADFIQYLAAETHVDRATAIDQVAKWVESLKKELETAKEYCLGSMGRFVMGNVRMEFVPALDAELSPDSFGLTSFTLREETSVPEAAAAPVPEKGTGEPEPVAEEDGAEVPGPQQEPVEDGGLSGKRPRHPGRTVFYTLLVLLLLCVISMGVFALLRPVEFVEKKDWCVAKIMSIFNGASDTSALAPESLEKTEPEWNLEETDTALEEPEPALLGEDTVEKANCYIIIGGFGNAANADNLVHRLKDKYPNVCNLGLNERGTLIMVGVGPYSRSEAETMVMEISPVYRDCWILEK